MANPGELLFKFLVNGTVKSGQVNLSADLIPLFTAFGMAGIPPNQFHVVITPTAPVNTVLPSITGSVVEGNLLTGHIGTWTGTSSYAYAWTKNGTPIGGAMATTYLTVHGDVGAAIRFVVTGSGPVAPPATATSAPVTITAAPSGIPIANAAALYTALSAVDAGGKTYDLAGVDFGVTTLPPNKDFSATPVILQCDPLTTFLSIAMSNVKGVTINGGNIYGYTAPAGLSIQGGSSHITTNLLTLNTGAPDGSPADSVGFQVRDCSYITFNGNNDSTKLDISGQGLGGQFIDSSNVAVNGLTLKNISVDGIDLASVATANINSCLGWDWWPVVDSHPDFIQCFGTSSNITIQNCGWEQKGGGGTFGGASQGITTEGTHTNTIISNCWILGGLTNTFQISGGSNALVSGCFAQGFATYGSRIIARDATINCSVTNCTAASVQNYAGGGVNTGFSETGTTHISDTTPGTHTQLDIWLAAHPTARSRPA